MSAICIDAKDRIVDRSRICVRAICVPQAGMGAWAFHSWQARLPPEVEVLPVELPGRNTRMTEPKPTSMDELVDGLVEALALGGAFELPYVLVGHSMGSWIVFELAAKLKLRAATRQPSLLIVSGMRPPHLSALEHDADTISPALSGLPAAEFWRHFERRYGRHPDLQQAEMKQYVLPLLRADFAIVESYTPSYGHAALGCGVVACAAAGDNRVKAGQMGEWRGYAEEGRFELMEPFKVSPLPWSTPHRYVIEGPAPLQALIARVCLKLLQDPDGPLATLAAAPSETGSIPTSAHPTTARCAESSPATRSSPLPPPPPPQPPPPQMSVVQFLDGAGLAAHSQLFAGCGVGEWLTVLDTGRPAFLSMLADKASPA